MHCCEELLLSLTCRLPIHHVSECSPQFTCMCMVMTPAGAVVGWIFHLCIDICLITPNGIAHNHIDRLTGINIIHMHRCGWDSFLVLLSHLLSAWSLCSHPIEDLHHLRPRSGWEREREVNNKWTIQPSRSEHYQTVNQRPVVNEPVQSGETVGAGNEIPLKAVFLHSDTVHLQCVGCSAVIQARGWNVFKRNNQRSCLSVSPEWSVPRSKCFFTVSYHNDLALTLQPLHLIAIIPHLQGPTRD